VEVIMPFDSLPHFINALQRLPDLNIAELRELIRILPSGVSDPEGVAQQLLDRGWLTPEQFSQLFPPHKELATRETLLVGFGDDDEAPPDIDALDTDRWSLVADGEEDRDAKALETATLSVPGEDDENPLHDSADVSASPTDATDNWSLPAEEEDADVAPAQASTLPPAPAEQSDSQATTPDALPGSPSQTPAPPAFDWRGLEQATGVNGPHDAQVDQRMRQLLVWAGRSLLVSIFFAGSYLGGKYFLQAKPAAQNRPRQIADSRKEPKKSRSTHQEAPERNEAAIASSKRPLSDFDAEFERLLRAPPGAARGPTETVADKAPRPKPVPKDSPRLPAGTVLLGKDDYQASAVAFRDNQVAATADQEGRLSLWNADSGALLHSWAGHGERVNSMVFSADGRFLVSAGNDRMVRVWDAAGRREIRSFQWDAATVALSPSGRFLAGGCVDGSVRVWDTTANDVWTHDKAPSTPNRRPGSGILCLAFSPDSGTLAIGNGTGSVRLLDVQKRRPLRSFRAHGMVYAVAFRPDGRALATAGKDGTVKFWDTASGKELATIRDPNGQPVVSAVYGPQGQYLATASWDGVIRLWNLGMIGFTKPAATIPLPAAGFGQQIAFSPNGRLLASVHGGNPAYVLPVQP
jgi:hypothetical protein